MTVHRHSRRPYAYLQVLILALTAAAIAVGTVGLYYVEQRLVAVAGENLALAAAQTAQHMDRVLLERQGDAQMMARAFARQIHSLGFLTEYVVWMRAHYSAYLYLWLGVTDAEGRIIASSDASSVGQDYGREVWFEAVRRTRAVHVGDVEPYEAGGGVDSVAFTAPIVGPQGEFLGVVTTRIGLPAIEEQVTRTVRMFEQQEGFIGTIEYQFLTDDGRVFIDSDLEHKGLVNLKRMGLPSALLSDRAQPGYVEEDHLRRHVPVVTGYARTNRGEGGGGLQWTVLLRMDRSNIVAPIQTVLWKLGLAGAIVMAPLLGFLLWSAGRLRAEWVQAELESTRAKAAEEALRESETRTRVIVETALDAVVVMASDGRITEWNAHAETVFGWPRAEAIGRVLAETIIPPAHREAHERGLRRFLETGQGPLLNRRVEITACRRDGGEFPVELAITPARQGNVHTFSAFVRDITQRKESEKRQAAQLAVTVALSEARTLDDAAPKLLQAVCETVGWELGVIWRVDRAAALLRCERIWHAPLKGIEAFAALSRDTTFPKGVGLPGRVWATGQSVWITDVLKDANFPRASGAAQVGLHGAIGFPIVLGGELLGVLEFFSRQVRQPDDDLQRMMAEIGIKVGQFIERGLLEEQLRQSQKMDAIGRLAGGIAHDFNNLLTVISGYSQLLLNQLDVGDERRDKAEEIKNAGARAAVLTKQLLAFSRKQVLAARVLDLNELVAGMNGMLRRVIGEDIDLVTLSGSSLGSIKADPGQIEQVIVNLVINARDAMPQGGRVTIETANVEVEAAVLSQSGSVQPGPYVMLAVSDTGCGMDPHTQANMFEPFFTTKEQGKGTGLGLATVYGIIKQSGGHILVSSKVGVGTTVKVYLPRVHQAAAAAAESVPVADRPVNGSETVLLVEDEDSIRKLLGQQLRIRGYTVLEAGKGEEAMDLCRRHRGPIHLLLTDVVMPQISGRELAERLASVRPDMRVLYMSGYTDDAVVRHGVLESDVSFVQKPFTPSQLLRKVRDVLDVRR
ncbi:MAG: PAS domain S-box protein [Nitrospirota bacterium]|nr:PAS domain S-box protein [Nitrospirota bacterium]MDE3118494.1 PAS domain S-box protein [Nitrospirota bacterium]MDE3242135.1 PAS domain S-box protein [Nitrospirota bacterium]